VKAAPRFCMCVVARHDRFCASVEKKGGRVVGLRETLRGHLVVVRYRSGKMRAVAVLDPGCTS